jgi:hypothetical protein
MASHAAVTVKVTISLRHDRHRRGVPRLRLLGIPDFWATGNSGIVMTQPDSGQIVARKRLTGGHGSTGPVNRDWLVNLASHGQGTVKSRSNQHHGQVWSWSGLKLAHPRSDTVIQSGHGQVTQVCANFVGRSATVRSQSGSSWGEPCQVTARVRWLRLWLGLERFTWWSKFRAISGIPTPCHQPALVLRVSPAL